MKNVLKAFGNLNQARSAKVHLLIIAIVAVIGFSFAACEGGGSGDPDLSGTITISPTTATTGTELTAVYSGSESVSFQWEKDGSAIGTASTTNPNKYTPTAAGSYTVTVSAAGYTSKTSAAVTVTVPQWTAITQSVFSSGYIYAIAYGNGKFVAGGSNGKMATSTDGITWTAVTQSVFESYDEIDAIAYENGKFVAGGSNGKMAVSTNGTTWSPVTQSIFGSFYNIYAIAYGNGKFVAGGANALMATSTDGTTWTKVTQSVFSGNIYAITYGNGKFVAGGAQIATSTDGTTWTAVTQSVFSSGYIYAIPYGNNKFVAGGGFGKMATSTNGTTWTAVTQSVFGSYNHIFAIAYGNGKFVAGGYIGQMATSTDGTTWTAVTQSILAEIKAIAYGNNKFVAVGSNGKMAYWNDNSGGGNIDYPPVSYYTVTFNINGGSGQTPPSQTVAAGESIILPDGSGLTKTGYTFGGWNTNSSGTGSNYSGGGYYTVNSETTLYARWSSNAPSVPSGTEANPIPLSLNSWSNGTISAGSSAVWYSFIAAADVINYYLWWNDKYAGDGTKTLDIKVSAYDKNGSLFTGADSAWVGYKSFFPATGTVKIKVEPYTSGQTGTFAIGYCNNPLNKPQ